MKGSLNLYNLIKLGMRKKETKNLCYKKNTDFYFFSATFTLQYLNFYVSSSRHSCQLGIKKSENLKRSSV